MVVDPESGCGMRAPDLAVPACVLRDLLADLLVLDGIRLDGRAKLGEIRYEMPQALHVARIADVHRGRERLHARARLPVPGGEGIRDRAVRVDREDDLADRHADGFRTAARRAIAVCSQRPRA